MQSNILNSGLFAALLGLSVPGLQAQLDYGDAPDPSYPTLQINAGPSHLIGPLYLGQLVDADPDGNPAALSNGDDNSGTYDDEDGVQFSSWLVPGQSASIIIISSGVGFVDAWIDFQGNGNWSDPGDQIFLSQMVSAGTNTFNISVPANASNGIQTYARFRLSSSGGLSTSGMAVDGEVEDYLVFIGQPNPGDAIMDIDPAFSNTQNEVSLAVVPVHNILVAAYNDHPDPISPGLGFSRSSDQGQSWTAQQLAMPFNSIAGVPMVDAFDPSVACDDSGNIYVAHIATDFNWAGGPVSGLYVHKSVDGGLSWQAPVTVAIDSGASGSPDSSFRFNDRCQLRIDRNPASPYYQNIYLAWLKDRGWNISPPLSDVYVAVSTDAGQSFSSASQVNHPSNNLGNLPIPEVAANGDLYLLWVNYNVATGGTGVLLLDKSTDGGQSWGNDQLIDSIALPPLNLNGGSDARARGAAILRADPGDSNRLYLVYAADADGGGADEANIYFRKSSDGGSSWSDSLRINDDSGTTDQILPWMEITPGGVITLAWYDRRNDSNDILWDVYRSHSLNQGSSFSPNVKVNASSFVTPFTIAGRWLGEYLGLTVTDSAGYVGFCSSSFDISGDVLAAGFSIPSLDSGSCKISLVSDSSWRKSSTLTPSNLSGYWPGVGGVLPDTASYSLPATEGNPYPYPTIAAVDSAKVLITGANISYFRKSFRLSRNDQLNLRLRLTVDDQAEVYLNNNRLAAISSFGSSNFKLPQHDLKFSGGILADNPYQGGEAFDYVSSASLSSLLKVGSNEIVVVLRNLAKASDKGGFSLRLDIDSCGSTPKDCATDLYSDSQWLKSSIITSSDVSGNFSGVAGQLPPDSTFNQAVSLGQPYGYNSISALANAAVIATAAHISYFRRHFTLNSSNSSNVRLRLTVDDQAELYLNGHRLALVSAFTPQNFKLPPFDALYLADSLYSNGFMGGDSFDWLFSGDLDSVLQSGDNQLTIAVRNLGKVSDKGGFSLSLQIDSCGNRLIPKARIRPASAMPSTESAVAAALFPNPVNTNANLSLILARGYHLEVAVYDLMGKSISSLEERYYGSGSHTLNWSTKALPSGIYLLQLKFRSPEGNLLIKRMRMLKS